LPLTHSIPSSYKGSCHATTYLANSNKKVQNLVVAMDADDMVFIDNAPSMTVISSFRELPHRFFEPKAYARYQPNHHQNPPPVISNEFPNQPMNKSLLPLLHEKDGVGKIASETGTEDCQHPILLGQCPDPGAGKIGTDTDEERGRDAPDEKYPPPAPVLPYCPTKHLPYPHCHDPSAVPPVSPRLPHSRKNLTNFIF
jgi:hypothetical protein